MYYLTEDGKTSQDIILKCIDDMLSIKNRDHIYYTHNLGGFDIVFLLKALKEANKEKGFEDYNIKSNLSHSEEGGVQGVRERRILLLYNI